MAELPDVLPPVAPVIHPKDVRDPAVTVEYDGDWVELTHSDGREFGVFVFANSRHRGYWAAFEGPSRTQMYRALSGGYASRDEAVAAGIALLVTGEIRLPEAEAGGVVLDPASEWQLMQAEPYAPVGRGWIAAVDRVRDGSRDRFGLVLTDAEFERVWWELECGVQPRISFPTRRLIDNMEAAILRLDAVRARGGL